MKYSLLLFIILTSCGSETPWLKEIEVYPLYLEMARQSTGEVFATAIYSDGSKKTKDDFTWFFDPASSQKETKKEGLFVCNASLIQIYACIDTHDIEHHEIPIICSNIASISCH